MNYRHIFHAGNSCDVVKHAILTLILSHLKTKDKSFAILDTHAGAGLYDLADARALKTEEAESGIKSLLAAPALPELADYYAVLRKLNPLWDGTTDTTGFRVYPGSPLLAYHLLRPQDRVIACEKHPEDAETLRLLSPADKLLQTHCRDGYAALGAFLPPEEKRGLVLIDPPYEQSDEFDVLTRAIIDAHRRWPTGTFMIWYPIKDRPAIWKFHEALIVAKIPKILCAEFIYDAQSRPNILSGSGQLIINPPWKLDNQLTNLFTSLHQSLHTDFAGDSVKWLRE